MSFSGSHWKFTTRATLLEKDLSSPNFNGTLEYIGKGSAKHGQQTKNTLLAKEGNNSHRLATWKL